MSENKLKLLSEEQRKIYLHNVDQLGKFPKTNAFSRESASRREAENATLEELAEERYRRMVAEKALEIAVDTYSGMSVERGLQEVMELAAKEMEGK